MRRRIVSVVLALGLAVTIPIAAVFSGVMTVAILVATWKISPRRE